MLTDKQLDAANTYGEWLRVYAHERELPANDRVRASGGCFAIAQDHHHAIVVLLDARLYASVFSLVRITFEAYIRGEWLASCATDAEVRQFLKGKEPKQTFAELIDAIEKASAFNEQVLSTIKKRTWKAMCGYTHTGGLHVQRWNTEDGIEPNYSVEEILEALRFAEIIASLSVLGVLTLANDEVMALQVLERFKTRQQTFS
jgi:hypothetical protein